MATTKNTPTECTVIGLFESRAAAEQAIDALLREGFSQDEMSVIAGDMRSANPASDIPNISPVITHGTTDAGTGMAIGGLAGFAGGILALAIPGIGPILAAGPLAAGIMGASIGAAAGGLYGGLKEHGVPENDAALLSEAIRRGRVMLALHARPDKADHASKIMDDHGALDTEEVEADLSPSPGAERFPHVTPQGVAAARLKEGEGLMERQRERNRRSQIYPGITGMGSMPNA